MFFFGMPDRQGHSSALPVPVRTIAGRASAVQPLENVDVSTNQIPAEHVDGEHVSSLFYVRTLRTMKSAIPS